MDEKGGDVGEGERNMGENDLEIGKMERNMEERIEYTHARLTSAGISLNFR